MNVYMHGTPAQSLSPAPGADFSHGCIRLEGTRPLAEWVLRDSEDPPVSPSTRSSDRR